MDLGGKIGDPAHIPFAPEWTMQNPFPLFRPGAPRRFHGRALRLEGGARRMPKRPAQFRFLQPSTRKNRLPSKDSAPRPGWVFSSRANTAPTVNLVSPTCL